MYQEKRHVFFKILAANLDTVFEPILADRVYEYMNLKIGCLRRVYEPQVQRY